MLKMVSCRLVKAGVTMGTGDSKRTEVEVSGPGVCASGETRAHGGPPGNAGKQGLVRRVRLTELDLQLEGDARRGAAVEVAGDERPQRNGVASGVADGAGADDGIPGQDVVVHHDGSEEADRAADHHADQRPVGDEQAAEVGGLDLAAQRGEEVDDEIAEEVEGKCEHGELQILGVG